MLLRSGYSSSEQFQKEGENQALRSNYNFGLQGRRWFYLFIHKNIFDFYH